MAPTRSVAAAVEPGPVFAPTGLPGQTGLPDTDTFRRGSPVYMEGAQSFTLQQAVALAQTTDLVVGVPQDFQGYVPAMRAANPNLKVLAYLNGTYAQHTQLNAFPASEYMRNASGGVVESNGYGNYLMQFQTSTWQNGVASTCKSLIASGPGYDGCFVDMIGTGSLSPGYLASQPINPATGAVWTAPDWMNSVATLLRTVEAANPGALIEGNGIYSGARWFNPAVSQQPLVSNANIVMAEGWMINATSPLDSYRSLTAWQQDVNAVAAIDAQGKSVEATVKTWGPGTAAQSEQWHTFSLASFMLATGGRSYYSFLANTTTAPSSDSPYEHQNIGTPLGAYGYSDGVYVRYFSEGLAVANPGTTTVTYALPPGTYTAEDGTTVASTITLPAHTGHVLELDAVEGRVETPSGDGSYVFTAEGDVTAYGDARFQGSTGGMHLNRPIVGMSVDPVTGGYWLVASDGGIFAFGAPFHGSTGGQHLNQPVVGMSPTPNGGGYYLVASDGGIFAYGNARFQGSTGSIRLNRPIVGMSVDPATGGYWLVASDGGIFSYAAPFHGSSGGISLNEPVVGMSPTPDGGGYYLVASDGGIFAYGNAHFQGSTGSLHLSEPIRAITCDASGGYTLTDAAGNTYHFGP